MRSRVFADAEQRRGQSALIHTGTANVVNRDGGPFGGTAPIARKTQSRSAGVIERHDGTDAAIDNASLEARASTTNNGGTGDE